MKNKKSLKICFIGGSQAGVVGALTVMAKGAEIIAAVGYDEDIKGILKALGISVYKSVKDKGFAGSLNNADLLLSVHGREIVPEGLLYLPRYGSVNLHPYLYRYKGADPVARALKDSEYRASVGAHIMGKNVDEGKVLFEDFVDVSGASCVEAIYNRLYPCYCGVLLKVFDKFYAKKYKK